MAERLGCGIDDDIEQIARVGRTGLTRWERFLWQPAFEGDVERGCAYIIVDDVVPIGATFAALRSHIVRGGGLAYAVTALAHKDGSHQRFPIEARTINEMASLYGEGSFALWKGP